MRKTLTVAATAVLCAVAVGGNSIAADATTNHRPELRVHVLDDARVLVPSSAAPGLVHLRNSSDAWVLVFKAKKHSSVASLVKTLNRGDSSGVKKFDIVTELAGDKDTYLRLAHGVYYFVDIFANHVKKADVGVLSVAGHAVNAKAPKSRTVTVDKHNRLHVPTNARNHTWLHVRNFDGHLQSLLLLKVGSDTSAADLADFLAKPTEEGLDNIDIVGFDSVAALRGHHDGFYHLGAKGRYLLITTAATAKAPGNLIHKNRVRLVNVR